MQASAGSRQWRISLTTRCPEGCARLHHANKLAGYEIELFACKQSLRLTEEYTFLFANMLSEQSGELHHQTPVADAAQAVD